MRWVEAEHRYGGHWGVLRWGRGRQFWACYENQHRAKLHCGEFVVEEECKEAEDGEIEQGNGEGLGEAEGVAFEVAKLVDHEGQGAEGESDQGVEEPERKQD